MVLSTGNIFLFGCGVFRMGYPIKDLYGISTTHALWYPIPYHSGINVAAWQSISFVDQIPSIWFLPLKWIDVLFCPVIYINKYRITNWVRAVDNFTLLISSLAYLINMIILSFFFLFLFPALTLIWITFWYGRSPLLLFNTFFVDHIHFQGQ